MPHRIETDGIVPIVKPHDFIRALVEKAGGEMQVAKAMNAPTFQGTLWKLTHGLVPNPSRKTAERIAAHFGFPPEAVYSEAAAAEWADRLLGPARDVHPPVTPPVAPDWPLGPFISRERWTQLSEPQRAAFAWEASKLLRQFEQASEQCAPSRKQQATGRN